MVAYVSSPEETHPDGHRTHEVPALGPLPTLHENMFPVYFIN